MATETDPIGPTRYDVMSVPVDTLPDDAIATAIENLAGRERVSQIALIRWWDFMRARRDREYLGCLKESALVVPVSLSIVVAARFLRKTDPPRYLPSDLVIRVLSALETKGRSAYILGGTARDLRVVEQNLRETYPHLRFVGRYQGHYPKRLEQDIITAIRKADPDFVLIGPGVPGGDKWVARHRKQLPAGIFLSAPEAFDIFSDKRRKPSRASFRRGLDFIPGLFRRPWRLLRFLVYLWFSFLLIVFKVFRR